MFDPKSEFDVIQESTLIRHFHAYRERYVVRPPYQRRVVWSGKKQQTLLDSLFRRSYIPRIVLREVSTTDGTTRLEVIDGQQRITTVQNFYEGELPLPSSLKDIDARLPNKKYDELTEEIREFVDEQLKYDVDIVKRIENPKSWKHLKIASDIFWRLQLGDSLNKMEKAHAKLNSLARNFLVRYADDYDFNYRDYASIDDNPNKHDFFEIYGPPNNRMQHLSTLGRLLLTEIADGPTDTRDEQIVKLVEKTEQEDGIDNHEYEKEPSARRLLSNLGKFRDVFKNEPHQPIELVKELRVEYFMESIYILFRHLLKHYVNDEKTQRIFRDFVHSFHERWRRADDEDQDIVTFRNNRQHPELQTQIRDYIIRQAFFNFASEHNHPILTKDRRRRFNEAERIAIWRRDKGHCQICLDERKPEAEAYVPWSEFEADHVLPHSHGGRTVLENGRVLCRYHNRSRGNLS